ncbi:PCYCGC motif-containing (lipo)protein [Brevibacillus sp. H7]|uniref:PCYCGC motif-containing (lipo)protein n=1 Tax=Brevibacillus sp. H7 TaxID=3349138 RepID=UPI0037F111B9
MCGCGEEAGHLHNGNCFIKEVNADDTRSRLQRQCLVKYISGNQIARKSHGSSI